MKAALWLLLLLCVSANIAFTAAMDRGPAQVTLSVITGVGVLGALTGLAVRRGDRAAGQRRVGRGATGDRIAGERRRDAG